MRSALVDFHRDWRRLGHASASRGMRGLSLSLLSDPLIRVLSDDDAPRQMSLPEVLASLSQAGDLQFIALRPHQEAAWHAFLVQLAVLALEAAEWPPLPRDPAGWQVLLRRLTPRWPNDEPWCLVVEDWQQPAFMQPPGAVGQHRGRCASAQELDLLVTSKNHDEKIGKLRGRASADGDLWLYALVSLQGFAGYLGRGNFSTMRMNGGFASRPQFRLLFQEGSGAEFVRDVDALRAAADALWHDADQLQIGTDDDPLTLLWQEPWSDQSLALPLTRVHPLCLEVTRRVRLCLVADGSLQALTAPSGSMRVAAKDNKGNVLDPWIPLRLDGEVRALTAQADTFNYQGLAPLLFDEAFCKLPRLAHPTVAEHDSREPAILRARVLVGGSGRTDGYLRRDVPMPPGVLRRFFTQRGELALRAKAFVSLAGAAQGKVLRPALLQYVDGGVDVNWQNKDFSKAAAPWVQALERRIDDAFFRELFATEGEPRMSDAQARRHWVRGLRDLVQQVFLTAVASLPTRDRSRQLARGRAERVLSYGMRVHLADEDPLDGATATAPPRRSRGGRRAQNEDVVA